VRWNLALLAGAGVSRVVVNVHHLPDAMAAAASAAAGALGLPLAVSREPVIAGTGGALREARAALHGADAILMVNGDVLFDVDLRAALAAHRASGAHATMLLLPMPEGGKYAAVETDASGAVRRIAGKFGPGGEGLTPWHFSGVHVLSGAILDAVPAAPFERDVNRHVYPPLMPSGAVRGLKVSGYWNDLGTPGRYVRANADVLSGTVPLGRFAGADPFRDAREIAGRVTLEEIGSIVGMIPSSVTRLKRGALDILREILEDPKAIEKVKAKASKNTQGLPKNYKDYLYLLSDREKTVLLGRVNNKSYKAIGEEIGSGSSTAISVLYTAIKKVEQAALDPLDSKKSIKPCIFYGQMYKKHHKYLSELTELDQQVLGLKYKQHMTVAQIMKILNKPKATANSCITNAERRFKKLLVKKGVIS
jgi:mannose-1-phosphate guanylyltransferase